MTQVFICCLRRFVAHRGIPELIISDNAKTFKAAATQLARIFSDSGVMSFLLKRKIQLKFNLEKAPWWFFFFFQWMIKSTKLCLKKTLGKACLTYEELLTVPTEVECRLNSRPLIYLYPDDLEERLTPSHLISGRRLLSLPDATRSGTDISSTHETVTRRARYLQKLMNHLWNRWRREYIPALRESHRLKLDSAGQTAQIGDMEVEQITSVLMKQSLGELGICRN